ncbi:MAG: T9SS type A sorting domain-containing protein [Bacteroidaceae bacterium]|nr:T9SS type A sorting domain-containing protein [Bacteroidaceae bacterium]
MKKLFLFLSLIVTVCLAVHADHTVQFLYDSGGNRISRAIVIPVLTRGALDDLTPSDSIPIFSDVFAEFELRVHPNPTKGHLLIELLGLPEGDTFRYLIASSSGHRIIEAETSDNPAEANLSECPPGLYVLRLFYKETTKEFKIIKL